MLLPWCVYELVDPVLFWHGLLRIANFPPLSLSFCSSSSSLLSPVRLIPPSSSPAIFHIHLFPNVPHAISISTLWFYVLACLRDIMCAVWLIEDIWYLYITLCVNNVTSLLGYLPYTHYMLQAEYVSRFQCHILAWIMCFITLLFFLRV